MQRKLRAALATILLGLAVPAAPVRAETPVVQRVGQIPALAPESGIELLTGAMVLNPTTRRAYQIKEVTPDAPGSVLTVIDLDSLQESGQIELPHRIAPAAAASLADPLAAVDEERGRVFFARVKAQADQALTGLMVLDEASRTTAYQPLPPELLAMGLKVGGMSYSPDDERVYLLVRQFPSPVDPESSVNQTVLSGLGTPRIFLLRWDPQAGTYDVLRFIRSCRALYPTESPSGHYQLPIFRSSSEQAVWVACSNAQGGFQVVRVAWDQLADPAGAEDVFPGPERVRDALYDAAADRIIARYSAALGESWWVFDGRKRSWVGVIGASKDKDRGDYAAGVDPSTGRLYLHYPRVGLLLADARRTPVPQALVFPEFEKGPSPMRIRVDTKTRRIFIRAAEDRYDIFRDEPPIKPPAPPDPDANTTDVPEEPGKTDVSFTGIAQGYGARALLIGGSFGIVPPGPGAEDARPLRALLNRTGTQCGPRDREFAFGVVEKSELGNSVAAVRAQAAKADEGTNLDMQNPSRCDIHPDAGPPLGSSFYPGLPPQQGDELDRQAQDKIGWDTFFASQECSGTNNPDEEPSRAPLDGMTVRVQCDQPKERASAEAGGPALETDVVKVGTALSQTKLFRGPRDGVVSQVYSVARGVQIGDLVSIDTVEAWAEASANGRKKQDYRDDTASTRFARRITGLTVRRPDGSIAFSCEDCSRDLMPAIRQANTALTGRAEIRLPMPDPVLLSGTPGGYQAAVQKDRFQQIADNSLNNDASTEVPGLEIVSINDSPELRARQVIQLAGVAAGSSYGIFLLQNFDFSDVPAIPDLSSLPPGAEVLSDVQTGTTVSETTSTEPPQIGEPSVIERVTEPIARAIEGARYLFQNPVEGALSTAIWLLIGLPLYVFLRRRALLRSIVEGRER